MTESYRKRMSQPEEEIHFTLDPQTEEEMLPQSQEKQETNLIPVTYVFPHGNSYCCPYSQYFTYDPVTQMKPQSSEAATGHSMTTQNVTFHDYSPGATVVVPSEYDDVHSETIVNDLDLNNFFSRPVLARFYEWQVGTGAGYLIGFNPWSFFWKNQRVVNRISNFKLLRAKMHVRFLINGSPMHYGRAIAYYTPLQNLDDVNRQGGSSAQTLQNLVNNSQKPHVWLNPTTSQGGDLELPFLWHNNALDLPLGEFDEMGTLDLVSVTPLRHANGGTTDVQISVLAWATDVVLSGPTTCNVDGIAPQSDEYSNRVFSARATNVASVMNKLSSAPVIGPYARATALAASAASAIASLFGFSKPLELERTIIVPKTTHDMATSAGKDDCHKLSLDPKQELTIDPRAFGLSNKDEMEIANIASTESYTTTFTWTSGNSSPAGTILWNTIVDPGDFTVYPATSPEINRITMTASCFAVAPFQYWRGSIKYRFQVVCSALHKGRLRIVYDPEIEVTTNDPTRITPEYNLGYQTVVDISETKDFEITVGWGQGSSYRQSAFYEGISPLDAITPINYNSSTNTFGNGVLGVYVMNELTNPSSSVDDCYVVVSMAAGPDFEVACPTNKPLSRLRFRTFGDVDAPVALLADVPEELEEIAPQSDELPVSAVPTQDATTFEATQHADTLADMSSLTSPTNMVFMGESIRSFRTLLKRYCMTEIAHIPSTSGVTSGIAVQRSAFPIEPGYTPYYSASASTVPRVVGGKPYVYGFMTPLRFISAGFVGWRGAIRWKVTTASVNENCCGFFRSPQTVTRYSGCTPTNISEPVANKSTNAGLQQWYVGFDEYANAQEGAQIIDHRVEPIASFEVPFYTSRRFLPSRSLAHFDSDPETVFKPCWKLSYETTGPEAVSNSHQLYCAAGEDFTLGMFIGAPIVYLESIPPV
ncbi:hypothetical protein 2 [Changjiang crawfish virus 1]|uniref:hypothetical protein 2 n=1 Tax=Changjiang crawfish virus 1 TaxID=1922765 RepID=UPI00090B37EE|nr:hypothetical protein 2 [Changjiang crawfish virus 1]APG79028.1 hypothetical protein 2 [Changjiang crawfish virus 1]